MEQKEYWDSVSEEKKFTTPFQTEAFGQYVKKTDVIVDIGCGYGRTLNELQQEEFTNLLGFDFAEGMIERGKQQFPTLDLRVKEGEEIDLPDDGADAVILFAVLTCIRDDEEQRRLIKEIQRVLKPVGILYVNDFLLNTDDHNLPRYEKYKGQIRCIRRIRTGQKELYADTTTSGGSKHCWQISENWSIST